MSEKLIIEQNCNDARLKLCKAVNYLHSVIDQQANRIKGLEELLREKKKDDVQRIEIPNYLIPKNAKLVECYETEKEIIVIGEPNDDDENHNCDFMGCSSINHVLYRFSKEATNEGSC